MVDMAKVLVTIPKEDLKKLKDYFGEDVSSQALLRAAMFFLRVQGIETSEEAVKNGGDNIEAKAYRAGFQWGKRAKEEKMDVDVFHDGAWADSLGDWEDWADANGGQELLSNKAARNAWMKGTANGYD